MNSLVNPMSVELTKASVVCVNDPCVNDPIKSLVYLSDFRVWLCIKLAGFLVKKYFVLL